MHLPNSQRITRLITAVALGLASLAPLATPVVAATEKPTLLGFASGPGWRDEMPAFAREVGKTAAIYQIFLDVDRSWSDGAVVTQLNEVEGRGMIPYLEIHTQDVAGLNAGAFDARLEQMGNALAGWLRGRAGRTMLIAPLPEMNGNHPWSGQPHRYKDAYRRIRAALLDEGLTPRQIRFVFAPYGDSSHDDTYDVYYPGDEVVDVIGFAMINNGNPAWRNYEFSFGRYLDALRAQVSLSKPILVTQTASIETGPRGESRDRWLDDMFTGLRAHDQVIGAIYFNRERPERNLDFRVLIGSQLDPVFRDGYRTWSQPSDVSWIFDGRMDAWVQEREARFGSFLDIHGHTFEAAIRWLASEGITQGCNPPLNTNFCPDASVTRGQMAVFLARALNLPGATTDHFSDDQGEFYENAANQLYESGITQGCGPRAYCGGEAITRGEMAAFLARTFDLAPAGADFFGDDRTSIFQSAINKVARAGITLGCNPPTNSRFCPDDLVTRGQMAAFLRRSPLSS
jgi:hypothetical protein